MIYLSSWEIWSSCLCANSLRALQPSAFAFTKTSYFNLQQFPFQTLFYFFWLTWWSSIEKKKGFLLVYRVCITKGLVKPRLFILDYRFLVQDLGPWSFQQEINLSLSGILFMFSSVNRTSVVMSSLGTSSHRSVHINDAVVPAAARPASCAWILNISSNKRETSVKHESNDCISTFFSSQREGNEIFFFIPEPIVTIKWKKE